MGKDGTLRLRRSVQSVLATSPLKMSDTSNPSSSGAVHTIMNLHIMWHALCNPVLLRCELQLLLAAVQALDTHAKGNIGA